MEKETTTRWTHGKTVNRNIKLELTIYILYTCDIYFLYRFNILIL